MVLGGPIFTATLQSGPGGIKGNADTALYAVDSLGTLHELLRENQEIEGKKVKAFSVLKAVSGSAGTTRSFNANQQVVTLVTFTDGSTGIVKIDIP